MQLFPIEAHNPSPMTGLGNNTYLLVGSRGSATLVDAGVGDALHVHEIARTLAACGARLRMVLVTHGHADHASGALALAAAFPETVFAKRAWPVEDGPYRVPWRPLADGDRLPIDDEDLLVVETPGHAPDHVALWHAASRTAFTGDLVVLGGSVMIHWSRGGDLRQYLAALARVRALGAARLMPAHGPVIVDAAAVLTGYIEHREMREGQVVSALRRGLGTVQAIAESIYDGLSPALMQAARENVRAHLEKLRAEGRARDRGGRWTL
jgi:glyoxylase-like metal-dependent hydrolase (beta-lactamase superfamily II)